MGLILDTSLLIAAERRKHSVSQILEQIQGLHGEIEIAISVVTIAELMHGAYRAKVQADKLRRIAFIDRLCSDVAVHPLTLEATRLIGQFGGRQAAEGISISFEDLAIGVTALLVGYEVATLNVRHFRLIPGLKVVQF